MARSFLAVQGVERDDYAGGEAEFGQKRLCGRSVPDHTTFSRRSPGLALATSLAQAQANGLVHVVIDATGLKVYGAGEAGQGPARIASGIPA